MKSWLAEYEVLYYRWVYRRFLVADGNFKADHVRQPNVSNLWLSEGGGMFAKRSEYEEFLRMAVERSTVSFWPEHSAPAVMPAYDGVD
jgi:hypothetical protein